MNGTTSLALTPDVTILHSHRISDILGQWFSTSLYIRLTWENFERCLSASKIKRNANTGYLHNYREKSPLTLLIRMWIWISFSIEENLVIYIKNITRPRYLTFKNALWALNYCKYKRIVGKNLLTLSLFAATKHQLTRCCRELVEHWNFFIYFLQFWDSYLK